MNTHQQLRANLWCNVATGIALLPEVVRQATSTAWADAALEDFDKRFPEQGPVDTDHNVSMLKAELEILNADRDALRAERETLLRWKKEMLEVNRQWIAVDEFVRQHQDTMPGRYLWDETLRLMRERDLYRMQLISHNLTPMPLP